MTYNQNFFDSKIGIIEDSPETVLILKTMIETGLDAQIDVFNTFEEAHKNIIGNEKSTYDVLIVDIYLNDGNGLNLCREIVNHPTKRTIPVIMITADTSPDVADMAFSAGAFDYISKPFRKTELIARLRNALRLGTLLKKLQNEE